VRNLNTIEDWKEYTQRHLKEVMKHLPEERRNFVNEYNELLLYAGLVSIAEFGNPKAAEYAKTLLLGTKKDIRKLKEKSLLDCVEYTGLSSAIKKYRLQRQFDF
jgi:hypothetical protein